MAPITPIHRLSTSALPHQIVPPPELRRFPSYETIIDSPTHKYGNESCSKPVCSHTYSSTGDTSVTVNVEAPTDGRFNATYFSYCRPFIQTTYLP